MSRVKTAGFVSFLAIWANVCGADIAQVRTLFQTILSEHDESRLPSIEVVRAQLSEQAIRAASPEDVKSLLPLGQKSLRSALPFVRAVGMQLFLVVSLRLDSTALLDGYIDDLAPLLDDPDQGVRKLGMFVLGGTNPSPSPKALALLESHLYDKGNDIDAASMLAATELKERGASAAPDVLALVGQRPELKTDVIQMFGLYRITVVPALNFIHSGFQDSRADTRRISVDAVGSLPKDVQKGFEQDLLRLIQNPDEDPAVADRARQVYLQ
jgi:hypothetical protein